MGNTNLQKSILSTLCYFDAFDCPLTLLELWQWLFVFQEEPNFSLSEIEHITKNDERIDFKNGFYFLRNREEVVNIRLERYAIAGEKNRIAKKGVKVLKFLPFIKLVGICNNSGNNNSKKDSDIDLFIVTSKNRMYLARFFITLVLSLMRLRRHGEKVVDRLCLSFYTTEDNLDFEKIKIGHDDIYLVYWIANIFPIYDRGGYEKFLSNNIWIKKYLPNMLAKHGSLERQIKDNYFSGASVKLFENILGGRFGNLVELFLKKVQIEKMSKNNKSLAKENDTRVIISDNMLKFHENDRRDFYQNKFKQQLEEIL